MNLKKRGKGVINFVLQKGGVIIGGSRLTREGELTV